MGAVQNDETGDRLGGIVYSYSSTGVRIYHPHGRNKYVAYVDWYWGDLNFNHFVRETSGKLIIRAWNSYSNVCKLFDANIFKIIYNYVPNSYRIVGINMH